MCIYDGEGSLHLVVVPSIRVYYLDIFLCEGGGECPLVMSKYFCYSSQESQENFSSQHG